MTARRSWHRRGALLAVGGLGFGALALALPFAPAYADADLIGYTLHATAPGLELQYDSPQIPAPVHPVFTGTLPEATADLESGPSGKGFSAVAWPGALAGNLGTTLQQLNQFCAPPSLPGVGGNCLPTQLSDPVRQALKPANDPIRAQATSPAGPADASYGAPGALYMTAHALGTQVSADGGITSLVAPPAITFGGVTSRARSFVDGSLATSEATSSVTGIAIGTGLPLPATPQTAPGVPLVAIDSVTSTVKTTSDGDTGKATGDILIGGVRVLGVPASIDRAGIHVGPANQSPGAALSPLIAAAQAALQQLQFTVTYAPDPLLKTDGSAATATVQGMVITFVLPDGSPSPQGSAFRITLGKATAAADASPAFSFDLSPPVAGTSDESLLSAGAGPAVLSANFEAGGAGDFAGPAANGGRVGFGGQNAVASGTAPSGRALGLGLILLGALAATALGFGMMRMSDGLLSEAAAGTRCPLETEAQ